MPSTPQSFSAHSERDADILEWYAEQRRNGSASEEIRAAIRAYRDGIQQSPLSPAVVVKEQMIELRALLESMRADIDELTQQIARDGIRYAPELHAQVRKLEGGDEEWSEPDDISSALDQI